MKLPADLVKLVGKIVVRDPSEEAGETGIVFDWTSFSSTQVEALMDHFGDCDDDDFADLRQDGELKPEWLPFLMWCPDGLDDLADHVKKQERKADAKVAAYAKDGEYPQFRAMWFLHHDGHVASIDIDGTFLPEKKADALVDDYKTLNLREAKSADLAEDE